MSKKISKKELRRRKAISEYKQSSKQENFIFKTKEELKNYLDENNLNIIKRIIGTGKDSICITETGIILCKGCLIVLSIKKYIYIPFNDLIEAKIDNGPSIKFKTKNKNEFFISITQERAIEFLKFINDDKTNSTNQVIEINDIPIYPSDVDKSYIKFGKISVRADSSLFSKTATMDDANARLKEEAIRLGANAIINAEYE